ncbi:hypothetical protein DXX93_13720 [Thalassotalea euphylliae]|uniref:Uncharacterized protein n=1 Tax=Thalassotalea euphylliae TaxID=1655234 RepID=A0A3E0TS93_9GAMM|nr:hypothetical protein [Thalassotalea euphylliae]REL27511.1 hypothetical protein DXX93_13720 [Thalassotalea euphylliae]
MSNVKAISPLVIGALTAGLTIVNNAEATLIAGDVSGTSQLGSNLVADGSNNYTYYDDENNYYGEDRATLSIDENGIDIIARNEVFSYSANSNYDGQTSDGSYLYSAFGAPLEFSAQDCGDDLCLSLITAGTVIDRNLFETSTAHGILYETSTFFGLDGNKTSEEFLGNWTEEGSTGYVAFAYTTLLPEEYNFDLSLFEQGEGTYNFGWLEVTRGSINIASAAVQNTTSVPVSGTLTLFALGLAGMRLRRTNC